MKVDLETLQAVKELMTHQHYGEIVPTHSDDDKKDTFTVFTHAFGGSLPTMLVIFGIAWWVVTNIYNIQSVNQFEDTQIKTNIADIAQNKSDIHQNALNIQTLNNTQVTNYNDIILKLNTLQSAVEALKKQTP